MSDVGDDGVGSNDGNSFLVHGVSCAFKHFLLRLSSCLALSLSPSDGLDEVDEVLFPCFPECKWKKSAPMHVN